jgi:hypothetical protein
MRNKFIYVRFESRLQSLLNDRISAIPSEAFQVTRGRDSKKHGKMVEVKLTVHKESISLG